MTGHTFLPVSERLIISLCDFSGVWSKPYRDAGYDVMQVDLKLGKDARLFKKLNRPVHGILAAPVCTAFAGCGAKHWKAKEAAGNEQLLEGLALADACLRIVKVHDPVWWVLENPVGRLGQWHGQHYRTFHPWEFAGWLGDAIVDPGIVEVKVDTEPMGDYPAYRKGEYIPTYAWTANAYSKRTCLWGQFNPPVPNERPSIWGSKMWSQYGGKSERTKEKRSETPLGFSLAFAAANP
jgi:hypothetical protein